MEPLSRAEIESSVDSFPDLDYKFEHIDWADIMDAEEGSNPEQKLETLKERSSVINSSLYVNSNPVSLSAMPALTSLRLDDHSRGLPPLQSEQKTDKRSNGPVPTSFSGVLNSQNPRLAPSPNNTSPSNSSRGVFKVPAPPKQAGRPSLEGLKPLNTKDRKSSTLRPPPSPSSIHEKKRLKISNNSFSKDWDYVDDDFIFTTDTDITPTNFNSFRLPIPHSASVSTLESDTEIETGSAYSETSSTSTLTSKGSKRRENLPKVEDPKKLEQRQKQIDYGKNTEGYTNYIRLYPKVKRTRDMPKTPDKTIGYSHRRWLGLLTKWRKSLHQFDREEGALKNTPPKSENFPIHLEDANTFPTLPLKQEIDSVDVKSETMDEEFSTPFSYSLVLQNLQYEKTDPPIIPSHRDTILQQNCFEPLEREVQVGVTDHAPVVPTEGAATGYMSYSAVLKASKPVRIDLQPVVASNPVTVKEEPKEIEEIREEIPSEIPLDIQENTPPPSKPTYCQVLMAPKSLNPITSPPILRENLKEPVPLTPEEAPLPQDSDSDDSMEVDSPMNATSVEEPTRQVEPDPLQPLTYSQALRSKPPPPIFNANTTADEEHLRERNNELMRCKNLPNEDRVVSNLNEDIVPKENEEGCKIEPCPDPPSEQAPLTYSQVLSGIQSPLTSESITDRDIGTESEDVSLDAQLSESAHSVPSPPPPKSYRYLIPQSTTVSIQEQS